jgi:hypothetical protein
MTQQTERVRNAINGLLRRNRRTEGVEVEEMYMSRELFVARLRQPKIIEGRYIDVDKTVDMADLFEMHDAEAGR